MKWCKFPDYIKLYNPEGHGEKQLGGVSKSEEIDDHVVVGHIKSGYTGERVPVYNVKPFKLQLGFQAGDIITQKYHDRNYINTNIKLRIK